MSTDSEIWSNYEWLKEMGKCARKEQKDSSSERSVHTGDRADGWDNAAATWALTAAVYEVAMLLETMVQEKWSQEEQAERQKETT